MDIRWVGMTRNHFEPGEASRIRMVVLHATQGCFPGDYGWLRNGGNEERPVSIHYYIDKQGQISQMVADKNIAWHCGPSTWTVDGARVTGCNKLSVGIELENWNTGRDPYSKQQYEAALWLTQKLVAQYNVPRGQLVRHLDIAPGRKTDPAGFPWARFVDEVYASQPSVPAPVPAPAPTPAPVAPVPVPIPAPATPAPPLEAPPSGRPSQPSVAELKRALIDLAYRAAGGAAPANWPLLREALSRQSGMPVQAIVGRGASTHTPGAAQDDVVRPLTLNGKSYVLEAFGRDLLYAEADALDKVQRLTATPAGPLRQELLLALFGAVDPVSGFRRGWPIHQYYLSHMGELGVPIGPNHRLAGTTSDGQSFSCQHFSLDSLITPASRTGAVIRLSDLLSSGGTLAFPDDAARERGADAPPAAVMRAPAAIVTELRRLALEDLYQSRTGRSFDPGAPLCRYALEQRLGAPLGPAVSETLAGQRLLLMPFALDVVYCQANMDGLPEGAPLAMTTLGSLGAPLRLGRLSGLLELEDDASAPHIGGHHPADQRDWADLLLGATGATPRLHDVTPYTGIAGHRAGVSPSMVVIYPAPGPAQRDLRAAADQYGTQWHYYIDQSGVITRLVDERSAARIQRGRNPREQRELDRRSLAVAVEGGTARLSRSQAAALAWLLRDVMERFNLTREQVFTADSL